jgi:hypothetical protein
MQGVATDNVTANGVDQRLEQRAGLAYPCAFR